MVKGKIRVGALLDQSGGVQIEVSAADVEGVMILTIGAETALNIASRLITEANKAARDKMGTL